MAKKKTSDSLVEEIERVLRPGQFFRYSEMYEFVQDLEEVHAKFALLARSGEAHRALPLYELFLSGCYEKIEECDDSSAHLSMFFDDLFCGWVKARQRAGRPAEETVRQILSWKEHDNYGFCFDIEKEVAKVLHREEYQLLVEHFETRVANALTESPHTETPALFDYGNAVRLPAITLKNIYITKSDAQAYGVLCQRLGFSPLDCQHLAEMEMTNRHWEKALDWVERGTALEPARNWHNEDSHLLGSLKPKILSKLGRNDDALTIAWSDFERSQSHIAYEEFMRYVPRDRQGHWHARAVELAEKKDLSQFISLCVKTKEWERLAARLHKATHPELEKVSHYTLEPAAKALEKKDLSAAAKLYRALSFRIVAGKRSKYYDAALEHAERARVLFLKAGCVVEWEDVVNTFRHQHSRKRGFMDGFERIVAGESAKGPSFAERAQARWKKQTS